MVTGGRARCERRHRFHLELVLGVVGARASHGSILLTGIAGLVAGAMSMATGEFVSVSSLADGEGAALDLERAELEEDYFSEQRELAGIYVRRGLDAELARVSRAT